MSYKLVISGIVQGVSFRVSMQEVALRHGIDGWVQNLDDGSVEALVQGEGERVARLLEWVKVGPPGAKVSSVKKSELEGYPTQEGFSIVAKDYQRSTAKR